MSFSNVFRGLVVAVLVAAPAVAVGLEPRPDPVGEPAPPAPSPSPYPDLAEEFSALQDEVGALWNQLDRLSTGDESPPWAQAEHDRLDRRLERATTLLERLSARVETPVPRLDEPITLLTVSLCALILGFVAGRSLGRRGGRRDSRFGP